MENNHLFLGGILLIVITTAGAYLATDIPISVYNSKTTQCEKGNPNYKYINIEYGTSSTGLRYINADCVPKELEDYSCAEVKDAIKNDKVFCKGKGFTTDWYTCMSWGRTELKEEYVNRC